jgi:hypothetical protein
MQIPIMNSNPKMDFNWDSFAGMGWKRAFKSAISIFLENKKIKGNTITCVSIGKAELIFFRSSGFSSDYFINTEIDRQS